MSALTIDANLAKQALELAAMYRKAATAERRMTGTNKTTIRARRRHGSRRGFADNSIQRLGLGDTLGRLLVREDVLAWRVSRGISAPAKLAEVRAELHATIRDLRKIAKG